MKKVTGALAAFLLGTSALHGATLLPNGEQQFIDANGKPYANGKVYFYSNYPTCTVLKNTYQNEGGTVLNTNPVVLSAMGTATIFGTGAYCQVLKDQLGNTVWTKYTSDTSSASNLGWGGTSGGTANAQTVTVSSFSNVNGQTFYFLAGYTNTGALTLSVNGGSVISVVKDTSAGPTALTGGEVVANNVVGVTYSSSTGNFHLITNNISTSSGQVASFASATCPSGWLTANGAAVSRTTYSGLFAAIGTAWGAGNGSTTFNIPDLRGTFLRGSGTNGTYTTAVGQAVGSYAADAFQGHFHNIADPGHSHTVPIGTQNVFASGSTSGATIPFSSTTSSLNITGLLVTEPTTAGGYGTPRYGYETIPKNFAVTYCVQY